MALLGFGHHHVGRGHALHHGHGGKFSAHKHVKDIRGVHSNAALILLGFLSPRVFFSLLLGFGATGLLVRSLAVWPPLLLAILAVIGGLAFEKFIVGPFWNLLFGFASRPARGFRPTRPHRGRALRQPAAQSGRDPAGRRAARPDGECRRFRRHGRHHRQSGPGHRGRYGGGAFGRGARCAGVGALALRCVLALAGGAHRLPVVFVDAGFSAGAAWGLGRGCWGGGAGIGVGKDVRVFFF